MAMLHVECNTCGAVNSLSGNICREDLIGTKYEKIMNIITDDELEELREKGEIQDEWDRWDGCCPNCGSKDIISL